MQIKSQLPHAAHLSVRACVSPSPYQFVRLSSMLSPSLTCIRVQNLNARNYLTNPPLLESNVSCNQSQLSQGKHHAD